MYAKSLQLCLLSPYGLLGSSVRRYSPHKNTGVPRPPPGDLPDPGIGSYLFTSLHWPAGSLPLAPPISIIVNKFTLMFVSKKQLLKGHPAIKNLLQVWDWTSCFICLSNHIWEAILLLEKYLSAKLWDFIYVGSCNQILKRLNMPMSRSLTINSLPF